MASATTLRTPRANDRWRYQLRTPLLTWRSSTDACTLSPSISGRAARSGTPRATNDTLPRLAHLRHFLLGLNQPRAKTQHSRKLAPRGENMNTPANVSVHEHCGENARHREAAELPPPAGRCRLLCGRRGRRITHVDYPAPNADADATDASAKRLFEWDIFRKERSSAATRGRLRGDGATETTDSPFLAVESVRRPQALQSRRGEKKSAHNRACFTPNQTPTHINTSLIFVAI